MREREEYSLEGWERDAETVRYVLILDDNWPAVGCWIDYFDGASETRCVAPEIKNGFSEELSGRLDPSKVVMVVVDWFYDGRSKSRKECQTVIDWIRKTNMDTFVIETSFAASNSRRTYRGSNISVNGFQIITNDRFKTTFGLERGTRENRIYALQQLIVPELATAKDLDMQKGISQPELMHLFFVLQKTTGYYGLLGELEIEDEILASRLFGMNVDEARMILHCAFSYLAQKKLDHDERYYGMALSRMKMMLEDFRR